MATKAKTNTYLNNPNLPTGDSTFEYTPEMAAQYKKCRDKIEYFASNFFYITTLDDRGRIYLPKKIRNKLKVKAGERVYIYLNKDNVTIFSKQKLRQNTE